MLCPRRSGAFARSACRSVVGIYWSSRSYGFYFSRRSGSKTAHLPDASAVYEAHSRGAGAAYGGVVPAHTINSLHTRAASFTHERNHLVKLLLRLHRHCLCR
jgi:hypothetical protein